VNAERRPNMSKHPIENCQYYIWEEDRFVSYEEFKEFYAIKDVEDTRFKNFCIQQWAEYAMNYNKLDKLSFRIWVARNDKELKEKWKTIK